MKLTTVNSIETSSICNNSCKYCPAKDQHKHRNVGFMDMQTFKAALEFVTYCVRKGTQRELNLFGVGEPTLNPQIVEMVELARNALPLKLPVHLNTNGNTMTETLARRLKRAGLTHCDITSHGDHEVTARCVNILNIVGIGGKISIDPVLNPNSWAGQVQEWLDAIGLKVARYHKKPGNNCPWLGLGQVFIMSDGNISTCCIDAFANGIVGNVFESKPEEIKLKEFSLCAKCHHVTPSDTDSRSIIVDTHGKQMQSAVAI